VTDTAELTLEAPAAASRERGGGRGPVVLLVLGLALPALGEWNPFNLVVVDVAFRHPWVGVMAVLVALTWLWLRHLPRSWVGATGVGILGLAVSVWLMIGVALAVLGRPEATQPVEHVVAGPGHHVQAELRRTGGPSTDWQLSLYSERGIWSRQQALRRVGFVACADSCAEPELDVRFTARDELSVYWAEQLVYRVQFDPQSLRIQHQLCNVVDADPDSPHRNAVGCFDHPTGFWGWFSGA
jgi:hypothetical protein